MKPAPQVVTALRAIVLAAAVQGAAGWAVAPAAGSGATVARSSHWSLQPLRSPAPPGPGHPIDAFVRDRLKRAGLEPSPPAAPGVLVRRLHYDLTGLPPDPETVADFLRDPSERAYLRLVDQLLASPHHGERWARHWLDVARYGESNGFEYNEARRDAWPYRDWVVAALNADLPYDQFVRLQIAGDILRPGREGAAAVGFLAAGPHNTVLGAGERMKRQARQDELAEIVGTLGQAFLGLTVHCARCHDHKTDPVPTEDYYRVAASLAGVFHGSKHGVFTVAARAPGVMRVHRRGSVTDLGDTVAAGGVAAVAGGADFGLAPDAPDPARRVALAAWITHPDNPLIARVAVNRVWHHHFGRGMVATPNDFGATGAAPGHPDLLDWLAVWFRDNGYRPKALHRLIVTSATYRQSSASRPGARARDAGNVLLWRYSPRRVEGEVLRDALLAVAGALNRRMGGPGFEDVREVHYNAGRYYLPTDPVGPAFDRRTLYRFSPRGGRSALLDTFDCPDPSATAPRRSVTTTPLQALSLQNNPTVWRMAEQLAARVCREVGDSVPRQVERAWWLCLGRAPEADELALGVDLVEQHGLAALGRGLFNSGEFVLIE